MLLSFVAFTLVFVWLLGVRYQIEVLQDAVGDQELEVSLSERWSEDAELVGVGASVRRAERRRGARAHELRRRRLHRRHRGLFPLRAQLVPAPPALGAGVGA